MIFVYPRRCAGYKSKVSRIATSLEPVIQDTVCAAKRGYAGGPRQTASHLLRKVVKHELLVLWPTRWVGKMEAMALCKWCSRECFWPSHWQSSKTKVISWTLDGVEVHTGRPNIGPKRPIDIVTGTMQFDLTCFN
jgi:hypothetical protein